MDWSDEEDELSLYLKTNKTERLNTAKELKEKSVPQKVYNVETGLPVVLNSAAIDKPKLSENYSKTNAIVNFIETVPKADNVTVDVLLVDEVLMDSNNFAGNNQGMINKPEVGVEVKSRAGILELSEEAAKTTKCITVDQDSNENDEEIHANLSDIEPDIVFAPGFEVLNNPLIDYDTDVLKNSATSSKNDRGQITNNITSQRRIDLDDIKTDRSLGDIEIEDVKVKEANKHCDKTDRNIPQVSESSRNIDIVGLEDIKPPTDSLHIPKDQKHDSCMVKPIAERHFGAVDAEEYLKEGHAAGINVNSIVSAPNNANMYSYNNINIKKEPNQSSTEASTSASDSFKSKTSGNRFVVLRAEDWKAITEALNQTWNESTKSAMRAMSLMNIVNKLGIPLDVDDKSNAQPDNAKGIATTRETNAQHVNNSSIKSEHNDKFESEVREKDVKIDPDATRENICEFSRPDKTHSGKIDSCASNISHASEKITHSTNSTTACVKSVDKTLSQNKPETKMHSVNVALDNESKYNSQARSGNKRLSQDIVKSVSYSSSETRRNSDSIRTNVDLYDDTQSRGQLKNTEKVSNVTGSSLLSSGRFVRKGNKLVFQRGLSMKAMHTGQKMPDRAFGETMGKLEDTEGVNPYGSVFSENVNTIIDDSEGSDDENVITIEINPPDKEEMHRTIDTKENSSGTGKLKNLKDQAIRDSKRTGAKQVKNKNANNECSKSTTKERVCTVEIKKMIDRMQTVTEDGVVKLPALKVVNPFSRSMLKTDYYVKLNTLQQKYKNMATVMANLKPVKQNVPLVSANQSNYDGSDILNDPNVSEIQATLDEKPKENQSITKLPRKPEERTVIRVSQTEQHSKTRIPKEGNIVKVSDVTKQVVLKKLKSKGKIACDKEDVEQGGVESNNLNRTRQEKKIDPENAKEISNVKDIGDVKEIEDETLENNGEGKNLMKDKTKKKETKGSKVKKNNDTDKDGEIESEKSKKGTKRKRTTKKLDISESIETSSKKAHVTKSIENDGVQRKRQKKINTISETKDSKVEEINDTDKDGKNKSEKSEKGTKRTKAAKNLNINESESIETSPKKAHVIDSIENESVQANEQKKTNTISDRDKGQNKVEMSQSIASEPTKPKPITRRKIKGKDSENKRQNKAKPMQKKDKNINESSETENDNHVIQPKTLVQKRAPRKRKISPKDTESKSENDSLKREINSQTEQKQIEMKEGTTDVIELDIAENIKLPLKKRKIDMHFDPISETAASDNITLDHDADTTSNIMEQSETNSNEIVSKSTVKGKRGRGKKTDASKDLNENMSDSAVMATAKGKPVKAKTVEKKAVKKRQTSKMPKPQINATLEKKNVNDNKDENHKKEGIEKEKGKTVVKSGIRGKGKAMKDMSEASDVDSNKTKEKVSFRDASPKKVEERPLPRKRGRKHSGGMGESRKGPRRLSPKDNSWKEMLSGDEFKDDFDNIQVSPVKHINVRKVIKGILKPTKDKRKNEKEQAKSEEGNPNGKGVKKPRNKQSKKLANEILENLKRRNGGGLDALKNSAIEKPDDEVSSSDIQTNVKTVSIPSDLEIDKISDIKTVITKGTTKALEKSEPLPSKNTLVRISGNSKGKEVIVEDRLNGKTVSIGDSPVKLANETITKIPVSKATLFQNSKCIKASTPGGLDSEGKSSPGKAVNIVNTKMSPKILTTVKTSPEVSCSDSNSSLSAIKLSQSPIKQSIDPMKASPNVSPVKISNSPLSDSVAKLKSLLDKAVGDKTTDVDL